MKTPLLDGIRKEAGFGSLVSSGMRYLSRNPRVGATALGGVAGAGIGAVTGGDMKSTLAGAGLGAAGGYGASRMGFDPSKFWRKTRGGFQRMRRNVRQPGTMPASAANQGGAGASRYAHLAE